MATDHYSLQFRVCERKEEDTTGPAVHYTLYDTPCILSQANWSRVKSLILSQVMAACKQRETPKFRRPLAPVWRIFFGSLDNKTLGTCFNRSLIPSMIPSRYFCDFLSTSNQNTSSSQQHVNVQSKSKDQCSSFASLIQSHRYQGV